MTSRYITYYEGLDSNGAVILNGNSAFDVTDDTTSAFDILKTHTSYLLQDCKKTHGNVARILIKSISKL